MPVLGEGLPAHRLTVEAARATGLKSIPLSADGALGARHWKELAVALPHQTRASESSWSSTARGWRSVSRGRRRPSR
ncbi:hypothetical protein EIL87_01945 [Saccharopolyspora rhizosphaerae]|uniref:Uncharacterized protein n=1 Tax=Saccharopolyspora rhizosphaerae TaxID=2492662 RepID=A0A426K5H0_9PSEU|nr:hypothetical protein [Saccharopolyspora rhizosphaerae]RRO20653.1 hypothetical protein EIL87_01945 [Saccharopolyspora rhizosphaerae]